MKKVLIYFALYIVINMVILWQVTHPIDGETAIFTKSDENLNHSYCINGAKFNSQY